LRIIPLQTLAALAVALNLGAAAADPESGGHTLRIELDMFSGRPNPEWTLTPTQGAELDGIAASLPVMAAPPPPFDGLGYRGIVATDPARPGWSLVAFHDTVHLGTAGGIEVRTDPGATVERWLLGTAPADIDPALLARIPR